jgi:hypothetical protein
MSHSIVRRLVVVLALSAFLGSPATSLAGSRPYSAVRHPRSQAAARGPLSRLWDAVVRIWEKNGCGAEPYGQCLPATQRSADDGCNVGLDGRCVAGTSALTTIVK